jgi:hypothetical protein
MVIFRSPEGKPGYHQAEGLDAAMRFAEMLRNQEQVTEARIFRMDEVPIEFKTYYRVEMASAAGSGDGDEDSLSDSGELVAPGAQWGEAADGRADAVGTAGQDEEPEPVEVAAPGSGRYGLFSRG